MLSLALVLEKQQQYDSVSVYLKTTTRRNSVK